MNTQENQEAKEPKVVKLSETKKAVKDIPVEAETLEPNGKQEFSKANDDTPKHYDPNLFGYKSGERVPFTGNVILGLMGLLNAVRIEGTETFYEPKESFEGTIKTEKTVMTEMALQATRFMEMIQQDHLQNIDEGYATHQTQLQRLQFQEDQNQESNQGDGVVFSEVKEEEGEEG